MNPRTVDIASRVVGFAAATSTSVERAVEEVATQLDLSPVCVLDCYEKVYEATLSDSYDPTDEDWQTLNTDPRFGNEFGFVSLPTLLFLISAALAVLYMLT